MNHNIRYELKPLDNCEITIEVTTSVGSMPGPGSTGVPGLGLLGGGGGTGVFAEVYDVERGLWWWRGSWMAAMGIMTNQVNEWVDFPPVFGAGAGVPENPENYQWPLENPILLSGGASEFPFDGLYTSEFFTDAHRKLVSNLAVDPIGGGDGGGGPPGPWNWGGGKGYFVRITVPGTPVPIIEFLQLMVGPVAADVMRWNGYDATASAATGTPDVNVTEYHGSPVAPTVPGTPDVNVIQYDGGAVSTGTLGSGIPEVDVVSVNTNIAAADGLEGFGEDGYDITQQKIEGVKLVDLIAANGITAGSFNAGAIDATAIGLNAFVEGAFDDDCISARVIAEGAIHKDNGGLGASLPAIEAGAIHDTALEDDAIHDAALASDAINAASIKTAAIHVTALADNAIHNTALAENAINEQAIKVDSVTYEEISSSAVREIVNGVWEASVVNPVDDSGDYSGSSRTMARPGSMGHAMLVEYLSKNMIHITSSGEPGEVYGTPMHITEIADPTGEKFYSSYFEHTPLVAPDEIKSYIDRTAVLFRGLTPNSGNVLRVPMELAEIDIAGDGWGAGAKLTIFDSSGTEVASETLEAGAVGGDAFYLQAGDTFDWEFIEGAGDGNECAFYIKRTDTDDVLVTQNLGTLAGGATGTFDLELIPAHHQQHLVRITDVGEDAAGQYFKIQLVDEGGSAVPGGIIPTRTDPGGPNPDGLPGDILIVKAETDATMHEVAHEVWEESVFDHETSDTFGMLNRVVAGLSQFNHQITDSTYDESGRLLACRLVVYSSSDDARNGVNPLTTIEVTSAYDEKQNMTTFTAAEEN